MPPSSFRGASLTCSSPLPCAHGASRRSHAVRNGQVTPHSRTVLAPDRPTGRAPDGFELLAGGVPLAGSASQLPPCGRAPELHPVQLCLALLLSSRYFTWDYFRADEPHRLLKFYGHKLFSLPNYPGKTFLPKSKWRCLNPHLPSAAPQ